ncbi:S41 family peptidase [Aliikangiella sp. IMCC44653]
MKLKLIFCLLICYGSSLIASPGYYRFPTLHQDNIIFTAEGDLWLTQPRQALAQRLTTNKALESQPSISFDGKQIAFVANYDGASEVYVMPLSGGVAKRITYENSQVKLHAWTHSGEILYSSNNRVGPTGNWTLRQVNPATLITRSIPLADAVEGQIDPANQSLYFVQFGLQVSTDNAMQYRGGAIGELWQYQLGSTKEAVKLSADHQGSISNPMVSKNKVYFISDATGCPNIWQMDKDGSNKQALTQHTQWAVKSARLNNNKIIYQLGADLILLDLATQQSTLLNIQLRSDFANLRTHWDNTPLKSLTHLSLAQKQKKVVITARGKVAIANVDGSRLIEIDTPANSRTRKAILSPNGQWVYALNDASGEVEIWRFAADGSKQRKQLTFDANTFRWHINISPNGEYIAHDDKNGNLWLLNLKTLKNKQIMRHQESLTPYTNVVWSNNSQMLAIATTHKDKDRSQVALYSILEDKYQLLTSEKYHSFSPAFSQDNQWLYFLSNRHFNAFPSSPWGDRNMGPSFDRQTQIFAIAINQEAQFPFRDPNELLQKSTPKKSTKKSPKKSAKVVKIDWNGLSSRLWQLPLDPGNYRALQLSSKFLYVIDRITEPNSKPQVLVAKIEPNTKFETFSKDVAELQMDPQGKNLLIRKNGGDNQKLFIVDVGAKFPKETKDAKVAVSSWQIKVEPQQEWQQIFHDAWLMHRDSLFDPTMRGVNWKQVKQKYAPLLQRLTDRHELNDLFTQMMGELNTLHSQVRGGDFGLTITPPKVASLGAIYNQTKQGVQIDHIFEYDPELPLSGSPLSFPGVNAKNNDIIVSVNGQPTPTIASLNEQLLNQVGAQVLLQLKRGDKQIKTLVIPVSHRAEYTLRYNDWVTRTRNTVTQANPNIGYLHIHAMGAKDIAEFAREFYANYNKPALIIDVRRNRGGNIDAWIIEKLLKKAWMFWQAGNGAGYSNMQQTFRGHLVVLADQFTYSDGETFTAGIKALNLAPIIGKQTAGAGVWLRGLNRLTDKGIARVAEYPQFAMNGEWVVEGFGVTPTIEVDNLPFATFNGKDAQLETAIEYLEQKMLHEPLPKLQGKLLSPANTPAKDITVQ